MSKFNLEALEQFNKELQADAPKGLFRVQKILPGTYKTFRLQTPTQDDMEGLPCQRITTYFIDNKPYLSLNVFGLDCPLEEEYKRVVASTDPELTALRKSDKFSRTETVLFVALMLQVDVDPNTYEPIGASVEGGTPLMLQTTPKIGSAIISEMTTRKNLVQCGEGSITNREGGRNILISKEVANGNTSYSVKLDDKLDLSDPKYDIYYKETADIKGYLNAIRKDPDYLRAAIRSYFYGESFDPDMLQAPTKGSILDGLADLDKSDS